MTKRQKGLTLIELMVVVAVLALLSAVAYPLYPNQVQKSRRADAKTALQTIALAQERFFTINGEYAGNLSTLQVSPDIQGGASDEGYYTITLTLAGADNEQFTVTAAAGGPQAADTDCAQFTINHQGVKTATDGGSTNCW
ncbi:MAG: type IV pilin protein [Sedimenticolaceae bacterium]